MSPSSFWGNVYTMYKLAMLKNTLFLQLYLTQRLFIHDRYIHAS